MSGNGTAVTSESQIHYINADTLDQTYFVPFNPVMYGVFFSV